MVEVARARGVLPIQVALAWVSSRPGVTAPIVGASRIEQLDQLVDAMALSLTTEEVDALEAPYRPHAVIGIS